MQQTSINVDWVHVRVAVKHDPQLICGGMVLHLDPTFNTDKATHNYKIKAIQSSFDDKIYIRPVTTDSVEISGNFYKYLNHHNITGVSNLVGLVYQLIEHLASMDLGLSPTASELEDIRSGKFRLFRVDVNKGFIFANKAEALAYLNTLQDRASYPYRKKTIYPTSVYFGMKARHWSLKFYHKLTEVEKHHNNNFVLSDDLKRLADCMIRAEIRFSSPYLKKLDMCFGYQWLDIDMVEKLFDEKIEKMKVGEKSVLEADKELRTSADKKFYAIWTTGLAEKFYSMRTIQRYAKKFLEEYSINLNTIITN